MHLHALQGESVTTTTGVLVSSVGGEGEGHLV